MDTGTKQNHASINVTPLIDVLLVLLIIFMVIQPTIARGLDTLVPQPPRNDRAKADPRTVVLEVQRHGEKIGYEINGGSIAEPQLRATLATIFAARSNKVLFLKGGPDLDFATVASAIDSAHAAGVESIGLLTPAAVVGR